MKIGTLVKMKDDPWEILGIIVGTTQINLVDWCYKVSWLDDLCDYTVCNEEDLETVCE